MLKIGSVVGEKYKVLHEIGRGGMSIVYLAMNESANKQWAIKEVRKDGGSDHEVIRQNLIAETNILKRLHNEHLPSIIDVINRPDTFLIVMDYIEGVTLSRKREEAEKRRKPGREKPSRKNRGSRDFRRTRSSTGQSRSARSLLISTHGSPGSSTATPNPRISC